MNNSNSYFFSPYMVSEQDLIDKNSTFQSTSLIFDKVTKENLIMPKTLNSNENLSEENDSFNYIKNEINNFNKMNTIIEENDTIFKGSESHEFSKKSNKKSSDLSENQKVNKL